MKKCKKLLCLVLALVMALSLCTVAMADDAAEDGAEGGTTTSMTINSIQFSFDKSAYAYGSSTYVDGNVKVNQVNGTQVTETSEYAGVVALSTSLTDGSRGAEIYVPDTNTPSNLVFYKEDRFQDATQYYLRILFKLQSPVNNTAVTPVAFNSDTTFSVSNNCSLVGLDGIVICNTAERYETMNNGDYYAVYFELPKLTKVSGSETFTFKKIVTLGGNTAPGSTAFSLGSAIEQPQIAVAVSSSVTVDNQGTFTGSLTLSHEDSIMLDTALNNGIYIKEVNTGLKGWTYDDQVWLLQRKNVRSTDDGVAGDLGFTPSESDEYMVVAKKVEMDENGAYEPMEYAQWCKVEDMTFTNTYTENTTHEHTRRQPSTPATPEAPIASPKTGDMGVALYAAMALLSMSGSAVIIGKKRSK